MATSWVAQTPRSNGDQCAVPACRSFDARDRCDGCEGPEPRCELATTKLATQIRTRLARVINIPNRPERNSEHTTEAALSVLDPRY